MRRRTFNILTVVSLAMFVLTCAASAIREEGLRFTWRISGSYFGNGNGWWLPGISLTEWHGAVGPFLELRFDGFALLGTLILPVIWLARLSTRVDRRYQGRCEACGYDLRASGDTCPECGAKRAVSK